jgi:hypothetical protein
MRFREGYVRLALCAFYLVIPIAFFGQNPPAPRDPKGLELLRQSGITLSEGTKLKDGVLDGKYSAVFKIMGEARFSADAKLEFFGEKYSRVFIDFNSFLINGDTETCALDTSGETIATWTKDGDAAGPAVEINTQGEGKFTNCWSAPTWFFPAMIIQSITDDPKSAISYSGVHSKDGDTVEVLRTYKVRAGSDSGLWQNLTVSELQLDSKTLLPVRMRFWRSGGRDVPVPASDPLSLSNNPVEVRYSDYRKVDGILVPFSIDWSNHGVMDSLSIRIQTVRLNTGIGPEKFGLPKNIEPKKVPLPNNP